LEKKRYLALKHFLIMSRKKIELEYNFSTSPKVLYERLSTPSGLSEWFADDVNVKGDVFIFIWDKSEQAALIINKKENKYIRFQWEENEGSPEYFEFRIKQDELTGEIALTITDFTDDVDETDAISLWQSQVNELKRTLGV